MHNDMINIFLENKDPERASQMAAYMKDQFPFLGIPKPKRELLSKEYMKQFKKQGELDWEFVNMLWSMSEREFQYLAVDYLLKLIDSLQEKDIENIKPLIITKSWWDTVDTMATRIIGPLCLKYPELINIYIVTCSHHLRSGGFLGSTDYCQYIYRAIPVCPTVLSYFSGYS